jgi:hypothetical protein
LLWTDKLNLHVHADYAPPRSWEQFEELCADVFQSAWRDPALVRNGRAGQRQHGVDIVACNGAVYPIGLQCKKRNIWPVSKLTTAEIDTEVAKALNFKPPLKAFFVLTTAPDDANLFNHVRKINERHQKDNLFEVVLLGWNEIVRRATIDSSVADKHFGPAGGGAPRSPLLATWIMYDGKLEKTRDELALSVTELVQDLHDWPTGHFVIRQRESDEIRKKLRIYEGRGLSTAERRARVALRKELHALTDAEDRAVRAVNLMITDPELSAWFLKVWEPYGDLPLAIEAFVNNELRPELVNNPPYATLRMSPPRDPERRCSTGLSEQEASSIQSLIHKRMKLFGKPATDTVAELPDEIRARKATPRIIRGIVEFSSSEWRLSWDQIQHMGALDIGDWNVSMV